MAQTVGSLSQFVSSMEAVTREVESTFGPLRTEQLNWKPGPDSWSIAQCLDHLINVNKAYFPTIEQVKNPAWKPNVWQRLPVLPGLIGNLLANAVSPDAKRKIKAPGKFQPSQSSIDAGVVKSFVAMQGKLLDLINSTSGLDLTSIIISSPVAGFVTYSLHDAYRVISNHEQRHLQQAKRVLNSSGFPRSSVAT